MKITELPIFDQVYENGPLAERDIQVWKAAAKKLDVVDFRVLTLGKMETLTGIAKSTLSVSLDKLCALGYLVRRREGSHAPWEYRIPLSRGPVLDATEQPPEQPVHRRPRRARAGMVSRGV